MLQVIVGGMFAGKTEELLRLGKRYEIARKDVVYIKPQIDSRFSRRKIVSRNGIDQNCLPLDDPNDIIYHTHQYDVFIIDEIQFYGETLIDSVNYLLRNNKIVICCGLDMDFRGEPFEVSAQLLAIADRITKLHAVCNWCGEEAFISARENEDLARITVGNDYIPLCRRCFNQLAAMKEDKAKLGILNQE